MAASHSRIRIPESALRELEVVAQMDWSQGVSLDGLVRWVNAVADRFRPDEIGDSSRAGTGLTARSLRHYQTLGCIDKPQRLGRTAVYRFRHYLQALLVRKFLWEGMPSAQIVALMAGRSNADYKQLLLEGIEILPSRAGHAPELQRWIRVPLAPGVELHYAVDQPPLEGLEIDAAAERVREVLLKEKSPTG